MPETFAFFKGSPCRRNDSWSGEDTPLYGHSLGSGMSTPSSDQLILCLPKGPPLPASWRGSPSYLIRLHYLQSSMR